jgi:hypothetical protein
VVAVAWFRALDAHTIRLLGADFGYLNLLVIPPAAAAPPIPYPRPILYPRRQRRGQVTRPVPMS